MRLDPGTPLDVAFTFSPDRVVPVGRLALERSVAVLQYASAFIDADLLLSPLLDPPGRELVRAREPHTFGGLHGVLADSLPDAWGDLLVQRRAARAGMSYAALTVLDKLAVVGHRGMGALTYQPAFPHATDDAFDLDLLARDAARVLDGADTDVLPQLERLGGSSGGARPKALVAMNEAGAVRAGDDEISDGFDAWLVKFRSSRDVADIGPLEAAYAAMARAAGVTMSESKLVQSRSGYGYFATKRFDRAPGGIRRHIVSASGLLEIDWSVPAIDYGGLLRLVRTVTRRQADVEQMFRRMVFNVVAHNRDDHAKQHAFAMDRTGRWSLAPAYDLTYSAGPGGEHYLAVAGFGADIPRTAIERVASHETIGAATVSAIIGEVTEAVGRFSSFAREYGVSRRTTADVRKALEAQLAAYAGRTYPVERAGRAKSGSVQKRARRP